MPTCRVLCSLSRKFCSCAGPGLPQQRASAASSVCKRCHRCRIRDFFRLCRQGSSSRYEEWTPPLGADARSIEPRQHHVQGRRFWPHAETVPTLLLQAPTKLSKTGQKTETLACIRRRSPDAGHAGGKAFRFRCPPRLRRRAKDGTRSVRSLLLSQRRLIQSPAKVGMDPKSMPAFSASTLSFSSCSFSSLPERTSGSF